MSKKAFVTGASGGIGWEFAKQLADDGWTVTAVARSEPKLKELMAALKPGHPHAYVVADLSAESGIERCAALLRSQKHELLVNNAGVGIYGNFLDANLDKLHDMMRLNMDALMNLSHAFLRPPSRATP